MIWCKAAAIFPFLNPSRTRQNLSRSTFWWWWMDGWTDGRTDGRMHQGWRQIISSQETKWKLKSNLVWVEYNQLYLTGLHLLPQDLHGFPPLNFVNVIWTVHLIKPCRDGIIGHTMSKILILAVQSFSHSLSIWVCMTTLFSPHRTECGRATLRVTHYICIVHSALRRCRATAAKEAA